MTIEERAARAVELKASCNCAQAVVLSYADKLPLEEETLKKLAAGYGGGMGCMEGTCGRGHGGRHADGRAGDGPLCAGDPSGLPREMRRNDLQGLEGR